MMAPTHQQPDINPTDKSGDPQAGRLISQETARRYWAANLRVLVVLLSVWFVVSFGLPILLVDELNTITFFGFKLGFWWAQQGSIYVFIGLIFVYIFWIGRVEKHFGVDDNDHQGSAS